MWLHLRAEPTKVQPVAIETILVNCNETISAIRRKARARVFYSGHVQGVGFRYTVKSVAMGFEASGAVRNLPDGRVELIAEGDREELEAFLQAIRESGVGHFIRKEDALWEEALGEFAGFEIIG